MAQVIVDRTELGRRLHMLRWRRWTLRDLERLTGVGQSVISRWERAEGVEYPDMEKLSRLAELYDVKVAELLDPDWDTRAWFNGNREDLAA